MRIAFIGAGEVSVMTAKALIQEGHEVVIVESNREKIEELSDSMDCSFLHGDGGKPAILREVGPEQTDILFCLANNDQVNLIASLVGKTLGFSRVITKIEDVDFEDICRELGLEETIVPVRTTSRHLRNMVKDLDTVELSTILKSEARFFSFVLKQEDAGTVSGLNLPESCRVVCYYRDEQFDFASDDTALEADDEVIVLTHSKHLPELKERWVPQQVKDHSAKKKKQNS